MDRARPSVEHALLSVPSSDVSIPVVTLTGAPGPRFTVTAGVHANEYVGEQALVELARELASMELAGTVCLVPIANAAGFGRRGTSMVPEGEANLNRVFPGSDQGSLAERMAHVLFSQCIEGSNYYVDLHSGDYFEDLAPHIYYLTGVAASEASAQMAACANVRDLAPFGGETAGNAIVSAAVAGIPSILIERGGMGRWSREEVDAVKADLMNLLRWAGIVAGEAYSYGATQRVFADDAMPALSSPCTGLWYPFKRPGDGFAAQEILGEVRDCFGGLLHQVVAPQPGVVLFQTASLNVIEGGPLIAYGLFD